MIAEEAHLTLDEIIVAIGNQPIAGSRRAVWRFYDRHGISFKKAARGATKTRGGGSRVSAWMREQGMFEQSRLVFVDETSTSTNMVRFSGRCPRDVRLIGHAPQGYWKTITFLACLRYCATVASFVLDGAMSATKFLAYLQRCLVPAFKRDDLVIMDNLPVHKALERAGDDRSGGRDVAVPSSSVPTGPQPDRGCPQRIEGASTQGRRDHCSGPLTHDWQRPDHFQLARMQKCLARYRSRSHVNGINSKHWVLVVIQSRHPLFRGRASSNVIHLYNTERLGN